MKRPLPQGWHTTVPSARPSRCVPAGQMHWKGVVEKSSTKPLIQKHAETLVAAGAAVVAESGHALQPESQ